MKLQFLATFAALTVALPVAAGTLTIGTGTGSNAFPFGGSYNSNPTTYQQVYASSSFGTSPLAISGFSFTLQSGTVSGGTYTLSLSTTGKAVDGLDTATFANNVGTDETQVYTGPLASQLTGSTLGFTFTPFSYNPGTGNLLLDVSVSGVGSFVGSFIANNGDAGGVFSRAHDFGSGFNGYGLQTTFTTSASATPEPAAWAMMVAGFGLVGLTARRRSVAAIA